jgi:hypothetical protein
MLVLNLFSFFSASRYRALNHAKLHFYDLSVRSAESKSRLATFFELYITGKEENWYIFYLINKISSSFLSV